MSEAKDAPAGETGRSWSETLFLPDTDFPMRAGLPRREPEILARWDKDGIYRAMREAAGGREKFILHDGPPYANGHLHIGHALNKILKDLVTRSHQMLGLDANYVPGWDCHGLPIEWKVEEENYRARGRAKPDVSNAEGMTRFRRECREFARHWISVQSEEFQRLGVVGDWENPYETMHFAAEAMIADELMKFAMNGALYRGSKPVMWSVVERTALAEAEVEYLDYESDQVWVKFPVLPKVIAGWAAEYPAKKVERLKASSIVIWTTTPWTIPGNRAICFSSRISYGLYEVTGSPEDNWAKVGDYLILADSLAESVMNQARVDSYARLEDVSPQDLRGCSCTHPLRGKGYDFDVPLLDGDHVDDETGTGFVHTAPGHGTDDFEIWMENKARLDQRGIDTTIPYTVGPDGAFMAEAPGFEGARVIDDEGAKGDANERVIAALKAAGMLIARGRLRHQYPHSWRSKKPVIFRNTPQWFIAMDEPLAHPPLPGGERSRGERRAGAGAGAVASLEAPHLSPAPPEPTSPRRGEVGATIRELALKAIDETRFVPKSGQTRLRSMIENRPDWVISRQRAWGVPITVFRNVDPNSNSEGDLLPGSHRDWVTESEKLRARIVEIFTAEGADAWFADGAKERFLGGIVDDPDNWEKIDDILDVWFESGSTHRFVLETRADLKWPADVYLEGTDQHRGWFHSSLLESAGTRGRAPYGTVVTHGFTMDEDGRKMSKSLGNITAPQDVIRQYGADILRLWVVLADYAEDQRIGPDILKSTVDAYRKLRNTLRWLLGNLHHFREDERVGRAAMPELERYVLHRLAELDRLVRTGYRDFDYKRISSALFNFATIDLSAFYFDIRKDALYCDPPSSVRRRAALTVLDEVFSCLTAWLAPMLVFTIEDVWRSRFGADAASVHLRQFPQVPEDWLNPEIGGRWSRIRQVRRVITGALEVERREKRIGSSLEAAPVVYVNNELLMESVSKVELAEIAITSQLELEFGPGPADAFRMNEVLDVAVVPKRAEGRKCARSWKILADVGSDPAYPDLGARDAAAMREIDAAAKRG